MTLLAVGEARFGILSASRTMHPVPMYAMRRPVHGAVSNLWHTAHMHKITVLV